MNAASTPGVATDSTARSGPRSELRSEPRSQPLAEAPRKRLALAHHAQSHPSMMLAGLVREVCDVIWLIDTFDPENARLVRLLRRFGTVVDVAGLTHVEAAEAIAAHEPDGILTLADSLIPWTAAVADLLHLPFHGLETTRLLTDKFAQRAALRAAGLAAPGSWVLAVDDSAAGLARVASEATFPVVLKPRTGETSRDTIAVQTFDELTAVFGQVQRSQDGVVRDFVVEEFIVDGIEGVAGERFAGYVSVESYVQHGEVTHLAITGRTPVAPPFRETGLFIPAELQPELAADVLDVAERASHALGIEIGCLHTEIKLTPTGPVIIEVNGRMGGGIHEDLETATGVELLPLSFRLALGEHVDVEGMPPTNGVAYYLMVQAPATMTRVTGVTGLDEFSTFDGVGDVSLSHSTDEEFDWRSGNNGHVYTVFGRSDDHDGLRRILDRMDETVELRGN